MKVLTRLAILLFVVDIAVCAGVTFARPHEQQRIFSSVYFAGLQLAIAGLVIACLATRGGARRRGWTGWGLHAGLVMVAVGGAMTYWGGKQGSIVLVEGGSTDEYAAGAQGEEEQEKLGFTLGLERIEVQYYPHSDMWRSVTSHVRITDGTGTYSAEVSVNRPLSWGGVRLYQMGVDPSRALTGASILHVSRERGYLLVYAGCGIVCLGLVLNLFVRRAEPERGGAA